MGIEIKDAGSVTNVSFNRIHLVKLEIFQHHQKEDGPASVYDVTISYRYYGVDEAGVRHYKGVGTYTIKDFIPVAYQRAATGEPLLLQTFGMVQEAVAEMIKMQTGIETVTY